MRLARLLAVVSLGLLVTAGALFGGGRAEAVEDAASADLSQPFDKPITWYLRGSTADTADIDAVNAELNDLLAQKGLGVGVEIVFVNRPDYDTRMNLINSSGEAYDLSLVTEAWVNRYPQNVRNEFLLPLSGYENPAGGETMDLLATYAPDLWESMTPGTWEAARINGEIFAVPNQQIYVKPLGISLRQDVVDALGLASRIDAVASFVQLTPIFATIHAAIEDGTLADSVADGENLLYVFTTVDVVKPENAMYDPMVDPFVVAVDDENRQVVNWYSTTEFETLVRTVRGWVEAGYTTQDPLDVQDAINAYVAGQAVADVGRLVKPGGALEQAARLGYSWYEHAIVTPFINTGGPTSAMTAVSSIIEDDPVRVRAVVRLLELVNTDEEVFNLIAKGIEGTHWEWVDRDERLIRPIPNSGYNPNVDWAIGNQFNAYYVDPKQVGAWPETQRLNREAVPSVMLGFRFDNAEFQNEIAAISTIVTEYADPLIKGQIPSHRIGTAIDRLNEQLDQAGADRIRAALEEQIAAWEATR